MNALTRDTIGAWLPKLLDNLKTLADGGFQRVEEKFGPDPSDPSGKRLLLVERKVSRAEPDRAANQYLVDRLLGKSVQSVEVGGKEGSDVRVIFNIVPNGRDSEPDPGPDL